jgi:RNA polymerase sigma factor (sigma-70 family)
VSPDQVVDRIHAFTPTMRGFVSTKLSDPDDVADVVSDAVLDCLLAMDAGLEIANPEGFLFRMVRRRLGRAISAIQEQRTHLCAIEDAVGVRDPRPDILEELVRADLVQQGLADLRERDREIIHRRHIDQQDPAAICIEMGLSRVRYRNVQTRAKARMAERLRKAA